MLGQGGGGVVELQLSIIPQIGQAIEDVHSTNRELLRKYRRELQLRKKCHNELVRLKGVQEVAGPFMGFMSLGGAGPPGEHHPPAPQHCGLGALCPHKLPRLAIGCLGGQWGTVFSPGGSGMRRG